MGIHGFNEYLRKKYIQGWPRQVSLKSIDPPVVAIDTMTILFSFYNVAINHNNQRIIKQLGGKLDPMPIILNILENFANSFTCRGLTAVFVFDGVYPQVKKDNEHRRRKEKGKKLEIDIGYLVGTARQFLRDLGFPVLQAKGEAERLCSSLCKEGLVFAVYSTDSDVFAHGCPRQIKKSRHRKVFLGDNDEPMVEIFELQTLLEHLDVDQEKLREICILAGCDYNCNIPGVAFGKAVRLINEYVSIDQLPEKFDTACLNVEQCRELFSPLPAQEICQDILPEIFVRKPPVSDFIEKWVIPYNLTHQIEMMMNNLSIKD